MVVFFLTREQKKTFSKSIFNIIDSFVHKSKFMANKMYKEKKKLKKNKKKERNYHAPT